jgi:NhaA family Na+:H+ antiporter
MAKLKISALYNAELISGILLILSFIAAILVANIQPLRGAYEDFIFYSIIVSYGDFVYKGKLIQIVNDGLMILFFLLIGLELKFHLVCGEFKDKKILILPGAAAIGGIVVPALVYWIFNFNSPDTLKGWAIPIATDTAFMLGILAFYNELISSTLRAFIIGFSLIDDAIALLILAIFYTKSTSLVALILSILLTILLFILNRLKIANSFYYLGIGIFLWIAMVEAGIHGTLCGVVLALAIPAEKNGQTNQSFYDLEDFLRPVVYFIILPLFAFINSGISFDVFSLNMLASPLALGVVLGQFIGKQLGIFLFSYAVVKLNYCSLPQNVSWLKLYSIGVLGGIGFTLSLFIGDITFEENSLNYIMRLSVIVGSLLSAILGGIILMFLRKKKASN